ncbi:MAG: AmmeMemoRadiSam system protein B, partial [Candidatus Limnocylindria bacterium]
PWPARPRRPGSPAAEAPMIAVRAPAVAGAFYPAEPSRLTALVARLLAAASRPALEGSLVGLLVPHAGLVYSGVVAATGWRQVATAAPDAPVTVVLLGTNHGASWLDGVAGWGPGAWRTPLGDVAIDADLSEAVLGLGPPFLVDREAHFGEHSIEVQLPILQTVAAQARIVPLAVSTGTGDDAIAAGVRLGALLASRRAAGYPIVLAISSDMAHYPAATICTQATNEQVPPILDLDPADLAVTEAALVAVGTPGLVCGMCGIEPAVLGVSALRAMGARRGIGLAAATSADAGGPSDRTVGYLTVAWTA